MRQRTALPPNLGARVRPDTSSASPRYFFHIHDGAEFPDNDGTELSDLAAARSEAVRLAGHVITHMGDKFWDDHHGAQWDRDEIREIKAMTYESVRTGGCLCGAIRYQVQGEPHVAGLCHCATCRKLTGSSFSATATWRLDQFTLTGEPATFEKRQFCPTCGSRLFFIAAEGVEVFLGTLDQAPYDIKPMLEVWTVRREHWLPSLSGVVLH